jgi:hypothetical protein
MVAEKPEQQLSLQSWSMVAHYICGIALRLFLFGELPVNIDKNQVIDSLFGLARDPN